MMVSVDKFREGLARYADKEIIERLPVGTVKRVLVGSAVAIAMNRGIENVLGNPAVLSLGIKTSDNMIDVELLRDTIKAQIPNEGMLVDVLGISMRFKPEDIETVYREIVG